jgi:uncharacterized NAD-dependent epimerase/dehydratase family protein
MKKKPEGTAIVYCEGSFNTPNGKTAHGLVRFTKRYHVAAVIDSRLAGEDAGHVLDGKATGIPICEGLEQALAVTRERSLLATHFVIGLAPDGGRLDESAREGVKAALMRGLNVDSGLHDFLSEDADLMALAASQHASIRDIRKPPSIDRLHFFSGKIAQVNALKVALLGTDSAVGKRTTAWLLVNEFIQQGIAAELIGTGQTAWMQGAEYGVIMDSLINDFVSGEIEHAVWRAWDEKKPKVIVIEGQGSLMNPAYPGGFEILAAGRPDAIVLQHAPARKEYDGFPGYSIQPLSRQIEVIESLSGKPVAAITINHENMDYERIPCIADGIQKALGVPAFDVLLNGAAPLVEVMRGYLNG